MTEAWRVACEGKLERAAQVTDELESELPAFSLTALTPPPMSETRWGVLVGDVAHNLRCCLDYLAWHLATTHPPAISEEPWPDPHTQFPIEDIGWGKLKRQRGKWITHLDSDLQECVRNMQPPCGSDLAVRLRILREISNKDKHRMIKTVLCRPDAVGRPLFGTGLLTLRDGSTGEVPTASSHVPTKEFRWASVFDEAGEAFDGAPVIETLRSLATAVRQVLDECAPQARS